MKGFDNGFGMCKNHTLGVEAVGDGSEDMQTTTSTALSNTDPFISNGMCLLQLFQFFYVSKYRY